MGKQNNEPKKQNNEIIPQSDEIESLNDNEELNDESLEKIAAGRGGGWRKFGCSPIYSWKKLG